ncbi:MAG TPA: bacillithiol system redox-active protein YtxJ [Cyclobacteriaceae bacterium]|nr:bacillithiol system redox-active protein YtxJ [Cyclobacteriaceae bacterium]
MHYSKLDHVSQLETIKEESIEKPVLIFKHSTRCSISAMAWNRLTRNWKEEDNEKIKPYYLDLITYREISNAVEEQFGVRHQSPQVIIVKGGHATYNSSHMGIDYQEILDQAK